MGNRRKHRSIDGLLPSELIQELHLGLARLSEKFHAASKPDDEAPDMGQCYAFGVAAKNIDELIDRCGLPAVPLDSWPGNHKDVAIDIENYYLDELNAVHVTLKRIEKKLDGK